MPQREGLRFVRLMMVISGLTPLFVLWAIRGMQPVPDKWLIVSCATLVIVPNCVLLLRFTIARTRGDKHTLAVTKADDHRDHLLVYLFAMLLPLYDANVGRTRDSAATLGALLFVVFLFWHLNLHYMNVLFALFGFRVFTIQASGETEPIFLLARRTVLGVGKVHAFRLSNTVFIEVREP
jgi:hypothetical protein